MALTRPVFFLDVDNTLLDNDAAKADLDQAMDQQLGTELAQRFWDLYEAVRHALDIVDYPETLRRFRASGVPATAADQAEALVYDVPYEHYRYPGVLEAIAHLNRLGLPVILSDGDHAYQPAKIRRAGLTAAVDGRVLLTVHKERDLAAACAIYAADRYAMVDDKPHILARIKQLRGERFQTILVLQGKYAHDRSQYDGPAPDLILDHVADLRELSAGPAGLLIVSH